MKTNYRVYKNNEILQTRTCKVFPAPYNNQIFMEYVMFTAKPHSELVIESEIEVQSVRVRPASAGVKADIIDGKIHMTLDKAAKLSVEINGKRENNLVIFADEKEYTVPEGAKNLIVIKKGEERTGTLEVHEDNTVIYFEQDAVLHGNIHAKGCNGITICGLGRVCMERYNRGMGENYEKSIEIVGCKNVVIDGIIVDDSVVWNMKIMGCDDVDIKNVKIFGCRGNSDGIDVCGSRNVTVSDIFTRVWDDSFVVKAFDTGNLENVIFKDSVLWNDFARPIEVGVELRADSVKNVRFENIDILHSTTGYPLMGIHHGDRARVSDIVFKNIRIEDAPGAQLADIRITDSVWNTDDKMGDIRNISFCDISLMSDGDNNILPSNSRIEGFGSENDIQNISFHNISINGKAITDAAQLGLDVYNYVSGVTVTSDLTLPQSVKLSCEIAERELFTIDDDGMYCGSVSLTLKNNTPQRISGEALLAVSPKNMAEEQRFCCDLAPGESAVYEFKMRLQPGKYIFFLKSSDGVFENVFLYKRLDAVLYEGRSIEDSAKYCFVNYYGNRSAAVKIGTHDGKLVILNCGDTHTDFVLYTAEPVPVREREVLFTAEETDFGEVCAYINIDKKPVPAPQLRCPAEITYVFENEPKVKEIVKTKISLEQNESIEIPFEKLGISADSFLLEIAAITEDTSGLRYPYTLFHSTTPENTAHMFGSFKTLK